MPQKNSFTLDGAGTFDRTIFLAKFSEQFSDSPHYNKVVPSAKLLIS